MSCGGMEQPNMDLGDDDLCLDSVLELFTGVRCALTQTHRGAAEGRLYSEYL